MQTSKVYITFTIEYLPIPFQVDGFHADIISYGLRHGHRSFSPDFIPAQVEFHQVCALRCNPQKNSRRLWKGVAQQKKALWENIPLFSKHTPYYVVVKQV